MAQNNNTNIKNAFLPSGFRLPRYIIEKMNSYGGFGVIYIAKHEDGRTVALKEFLPSMLNCREKIIKTKEGNLEAPVVLKDPESIKKFNKGLDAFFKEADTVARIRDDRVVAILDVFEANGTAYFAMPLEQGETLNKLIKRNRFGVSEKRIQQIFIDAASGIEVLHNHGILHLDIKPGNLWVRPDGSVLVLDLGASREKENYQLLGPAARTAGYAAPEQHTSIKKAKLSVQTDVYGLAASMYSCLEGKAPPEAPLRKETDLDYSILRAGQYSSGLLELIDDGLRLKQEDRIQTAAQFKDRLSRLSRLSDYNKEIVKVCNFLPPLKK